MGENLTMDFTAVEGDAHALSKTQNRPLLDGGKSLGARARKKDELPSGKPDGAGAWGDGKIRGGFDRTIL